MEVLKKMNILGWVVCIVKSIPFEEKEFKMYACREENLISEEDLIFCGYYDTLKAATEHAFVRCKNQNEYDKEKEDKENEG